MSTTAFGLGSKYFALYEVAGVGIQWRTISQSPVEGDDFNLGLSMMMLIIDAGVYGVLTWYIEAVHPGIKSLSSELPPSCSHFSLDRLYHVFSLFHRNVWAASPMVLPSAEILLVRQWACWDVGLAMVWRWGCQAQCDGRGSGLCNGPAKIWYR